MAEHYMEEDVPTDMFRGREDIPMMADTGVRADDHRLSAEEFVERMSMDAMKFRAMCQEMITKTKDELAYWQTQHDVVTGFLVKDQLAGPISGPDMDMPAASRMRREMEN